MRLSDGPCFIKFTNHSEDLWSSSVKKVFTCKFYDFYGNNSLIDFFEEPLITEYVTFLVCSIKHGGIIDSWNIQIISSHIPHIRFELVASVPNKIGRKQNMDIPIVEYFFAENMADLCYGAETFKLNNRWLNKIASKILKHYCIQGEKTWIYLFEKINAIPMLKKVFNEKQYISNIFDIYKLHKIIFPIISLSGQANNARYLRNNKTITELFNECDDLIFSNIKNNDLEDIKNCIGVELEEWLNCKVRF
ncbi:hypothetical protein [Desulfonema ishimotonii]|uniref:hypothetical protein n=1 Tax=Desulfonema ishimotonii TaxID=45657 RepID=UPI000F56903A|nr:hypothetical protein [Desulfonema ishimotonii]